jgi:hypothetical protein
MIHYDCFNVIYEYMLLDEIYDTQFISTDFNEFGVTYINRYWKNKYNKYYSNSESNPECNWRNKCLKKFDELELVVIKRSATKCFFSINKHFMIDAHLEHLLKVITMHTLILASNSCDSKIFIAEHNIENDVIKYVTIKKLLLHIFYNIPCSTILHARDTQDPPDKHDSIMEMHSSCSNQRMVVGDTYKFDYVGTNKICDLKRASYCDKCKTTLYYCGCNAPDLRIINGVDIETKPLIKEVYDDKIIFNFDEYNFAIDPDYDYSDDPNDAYYKEFNVEFVNKLKSYNHAGGPAGYTISKLYFINNIKDGEIVWGPEVKGEFNLDEINCNLNGEQMKSTADVIMPGVIAVCDETSFTEHIQYKYDINEIKSNIKWTKTSKKINQTIDEMKITMLHCKPLLSESINEFGFDNIMKEIYVHGTGGDADADKIYFQSEYQYITLL